MRSMKLRTYKKIGDFSLASGEIDSQPTTGNM